MQIDAILTFRNYTPNRIKKGMLFLINSEDYTPQIYCLQKPLKTTKKEILSTLGLPVLPYIVNPLHRGKGSHIIATPDMIEYIWEKNELLPITATHLNTILTKYESKVMLDVEQKDSKLVPFMLNSKIVLYYPELELA